MSVLVTGAAGFIGFHVAQALLARGEAVVGVDDLSGAPAEAALKRARLARLEDVPGFAFQCADIACGEATMALARRRPDRIVHLAARAGVRRSLACPRAYLAANVEGQFNLLELARALPGFRHLVYASSSSVYGPADGRPSAISAAADRPASFYAATKRAGELMAHCYAHLHGVAATGLRFFTVYGPWGRPDMAPSLFAAAILEGRPLRLFNHGRMRRDFTYIDDIVAGVLAALDRPPPATPPHALYNLGRGRSEELAHFVDVLEAAIGARAIRQGEAMQAGDVAETLADIEASRRDLGFAPATAIEEGLPRFVAWFRRYGGYG